MKEIFHHVRVTHLCWGVVLAKLAADQTFPWAAVPVILFLLAQPFAEKLADQWLSRRLKVEGQMQEIAAKLADVQNRMASLSLAAGLKRQGP